MVPILQGAWVAVRPGGHRESMIGTVLSNRYKIISELGSGGMAWVYLAEDLVENQRVAVKVLYPQYSQDLSFLQRFMQEAKLAMSLSQCAPQRYIVCVLDYGSDRDTHYLVMEFVHGRDLGQILEEKGALPWQEALDIAHQVALGLEHAHQYEVVHRDVKPGNIMILPDGAARVLDFGIARAQTSPSLTLSGFIGSPHYAAPEQAMGDPVDTRADIYSLGVVTYRMLGGKLPFQGNTPWAVVNQHIASPPPPLQDLRPDLPQPVIRLVEKAMAKRPEDRFQTPEEMAQMIEAVLAGQDLPLEAPPAEPVTTAPQLDSLYEHAQQAVQALAWQEAIDLYSQILKVDPGYRDVTEQLAEVGQQLRLDTLYRSARRALQLGQWDHAQDQLAKIAEVAPGYRDIEDLRARAERRERLSAAGASAASEFPTQVSGASPTRDESRAAASPAQAELPLPSGAPESGRRWNPLWLALPALLLILAGVAFLLLRDRQPPGAAAAATLTATVAAPASAEPASPAALPSATVTELPPTAVPSRTPVAAPGTAALASTTTATPTPTPTPTRTSPPASTSLLTGQIAFPRFDPTRGIYDVYVCRVDGSNCRRVAVEASQPDFLPDGSQVVLHSWKSDDKGLVLQTLSGQRIWKITGLIEAARPSVDFEGKIYAYHARDEADRQPRLYRTHDSETRPIQREAIAVVGSSPAWLPDGRILYSGCWQDSCGILVMRDDGTFPRQVAAGSSETNPEASPGGRQVAFMSQRDGNWEVYVVNLDGSGLQRLTRDPANDGLPAWSPDGRYIAFVSDRDGPWAVWVMRPDGSGQRRLFDIGGPLDGEVRGSAPHETHGWVEERISWNDLP
jgi:tRNA A-37 threonylcarbamoyl transferase component Bud32/tetratricopeptide (TPR) repeat protein